VIAFPNLLADTPDAVAVLIGSQLPEYVLRAEVEAENQAYNVRLCRGPQYREAREYALADMARANKILAAYDPRLTVRAGGAR
jgi:hypothetical protein